MASDTTLPPYQPRREAQSHRLPIRDLQHHVLEWGQPREGQPLLVLCHGWMDVAASYQFLVDALQQDRHVIAPDWRGFGSTSASQADHFIFADYLLDLDYLLDHFAGDAPVDLVGHSMGGNVVTQYAGVRPQRVRRLVNLEGFGLPATQPEDAPQRLVQWMDNVRALRAGTLKLRHYPDLPAVARRLQQTNARLPLDKALWLARRWAEQDADGNWHIQAHAGHKIPNHQLYNADEAMACLACITAPTLCVEAREDSIGQFWGERYTQEEYRARMARIPDVRHAIVDDAGHMLHHDQPEVLARLIEDFLGAEQPA
ncbi:MAG: alpha/beta hydrolase [Brachymonas denitrificans]|uniref:alpha/beta fold hydrolase n=1 Tax=Brachymonas denitrificans TaxID=28220 RepID=UPI001BD097C3|nr:alpha/beta hydrolase [Brachymonas denitrificans]